MDDHYQRIYATKAEAYHRMIAAEDADGKILPTLRAVAAIDGARIVDIGSGTGRMPLLLHDVARSMVALDRHRPMLLEQARQRSLIRGDWLLVQGDALSLPLRTGSADVVTAGWALGHFTSWFADDWMDHIDRAVREMIRVVVPGGSIAILETLGTAVTNPGPPKASLAAFYERLEAQGFTRTTIATDYLFDSPEQAASAMSFFFGEGMGERILANRWARVPEWTGIWSHRRA